MRAVTFDSAKGYIALPGPPILIPCSRRKSDELGLDTQSVKNVNPDSCEQAMQPICCDQAGFGSDA